MPDFQASVKDLEDFRTRSAAMHELYRGGPDVIPTLIDALDHHMEGVRWASTKLLADIGDSRAIEPLRSIVKDPDVGFQAEDAIESIMERTGTKPEPMSEGDSKETAATEESVYTDEELIHKSAEDMPWTLDWNPDGWSVQVSLPEGRQQNVRVLFPSPEGKSKLVVLYTECGPADQNLYEWALKLNLKLPFGAVALRQSGDELLFVMVNSFLRDTVTPRDLQKSISRLSSEADSLEKQLTGGEDVN